MKLSEIYQRKKPAISFEFFPPKTDEGERKLIETVAQLKELHPSFVSVTYGAWGTTRDKTLSLATQIKNEIGLEVAEHLTCVAQSKDEIEKILGELCEKGIENIVALRGDPPQGEKEFKQAQDGFHYASELVRFIRQHPKFSKVFSLAVAGYPEGHIECRDKKKDLEHLKSKVDEGADLVITQLFFRNDDFFQFLERARAIGMTVPIVPGIMPVTHGLQIEKFATMCGAFIPDAIRKAIRQFGDDQRSIEDFGIEYATRQCDELLDKEVPGLHFYTLNRSKSTRQIYADLGLD